MYIVPQQKNKLERVVQLRNLHTRKKPTQHGTGSTKYSRTEMPFEKRSSSQQSINENKRGIITCIHIFPSIFDTHNDAGCNSMEPLRITV